MVLAEKLKEEVETKRIIPQNQAGFRDGMGTMDNIYVLNYLVNRQTGKTRSKIGSDIYRPKGSIRYGGQSDFAGNDEKEGNQGRVDREGGGGAEGNEM